MQRLILIALIGFATAACPAGDEARAGEPDVQPVDMDTLSWVLEGRVVEQDGGRWVLVGPPVFEPLALTRIGEFEGTPLYAERGVAAPQRRLYIPVGGGYWQMLERAETLDPTRATESDPEIQSGTEGVEP